MPVTLEKDNELIKFEKINTFIHDSSEEASLYVAREIAHLIKQRQKESKNIVLGLATGSTPTKVYDYLVKFHKEESLSFKNVITFNLDEYFPMNSDSIHSYVRFMNEHLFDHVDILKENIHIPDGTCTKENVKEFCDSYESKIEKYGGIDIQILGIGRTGHIGFNEPGSSLKSKTRVVRLDKVTLLDAASDFFGLENVPAKAITMGIGTILAARRIILMAWGEGKAQIIKQAVEGEIRESIPATFLQQHANCDFILDNAAASNLTRIYTPWLVAECIWTEELIKRATIWLSEKLNKAILKLTNEDYNEHGMGSLIADIGSAESINLKVFNQLQRTITGWPGGKPNSDDTNRPERKNPFPKTSLIFSPHPDDDVISMGGTFARLVEQGHDVHIAYQTSGNIAVSNEEALKFAEISMALNTNSKESESIINFLKNKSDNDVDSIEVRKLKSLIRRSESLAATRYLGLPDSNVHFLDLPFYETGTVKKDNLSDADITIMCKIIETIEPHQIYAAGDLADPHGTHKVCLDSLFEALKILKHKSFMEDCWVWLYRGAWHEWESSQIEMAVPLSPDQVLKKRHAIFYHQSQKDGVMFQGDDNREFWVRVEDRNRETAKKYNDLGLADYAAIEAFKRYHF